ncbi:MAG: glycosyltransferase family 2 protein [Candidatus Omnitrophota bacterium]
MNNKKILIIIPAYNEEKNIIMVVEHIRQHIEGADIVVVNDGSKDKTALVAASLGIYVIDLPFNLGVGSAMQAGYVFAFRRNYDIAVQCDGDGQHPPYEIPKLIEVLETQKVDIVVGSRFLYKLSYKSSAVRQVGIKLFAWIISIFLRKRLTDTTSGFRALSKRAISFFAKYYPGDYPEPEALVLAHRAGLKIEEIPVRMRERQGGVSSIRFLGSIYYMVKVFLAIIVDMFEKIEEKYD